MDLGLIECDRTTARQRFEEYAEAARRRHSLEDEAIARGYKAMADGLSLISLRDTMTAGGVDHLGRPNLAIAPATATYVYLRCGASYTYNAEKKRHIAVYDGGCVFAISNNPSPRAGIRRRITIPAHTLPNLGDETHDRCTQYRYRAMVPVVPPRFRPTRALTTFHVLFEAEWALDPTPPVDPALVQHIGGDLWAVYATWDLTPLERAVLTDRLFA